MEGMKTVAVAMPGADQPASGTAAHFLDHCPYCTTHGGPPALLPPAAFVFALLPAAASYPPLFYQAAGPLFPWTAANPRAPPFPT
jgi:hypothetical protein